MIGCFCIIQQNLPCSFLCLSGKNILDQAFFCPLACSARGRGNYPHCPPLSYATAQAISHAFIMPLMHCFLLSRLISLYPRHDSTINSPNNRNKRHCFIYRVAQNKIPHRRIRNISATSGLILKILEAAYFWHFSESCGIQRIHCTLIIQPHYRVKWLLWKLQFSLDFFW